MGDPEVKVHEQGGGKEAKDTTSSSPPPETSVRLLDECEPSPDKMDHITHPGRG